MTTMKDVAALAGVSVATVSHVVNQTRTVSEPTARRVQAAIDELHYINDPLARTLRTGTSTTIGLIMSAVQNPYFSDVVAAIERATVEAGYTLLISDHRDDPAMEYRTVADLIGRRVDGLLLQPSADPGRALAVIARKSIPCVMVDRSTPADLDFVGTENHAATAALTSHLLQHGHTRIGMIHGAHGSSTTTERIDGYLDALHAAGVTSDPALLECGQSTEEGAAIAAGHLLDRTDPPTALISANNRMTIGVMRELVNRNIRIPDEIALACFDDFTWGDLFHPRLTCTRQDAPRIGAEVVRLLLSRIADPDRPRETLHVPATLRTRHSCGCPEAVEESATD